VLREYKWIFLWGWGSRGKKIAWVKWGICKTKEEGGLRIKNLKLSNMALLEKGKWIPENNYPPVLPIFLVRINSLAWLALVIAFPRFRVWVLSLLQKSRCELPY